MEEIIAKSTRIEVARCLMTDEDQLINQKTTECVLATGV